MLVEEDEELRRGGVGNLIEFFETGLAIADNVSGVGVVDPAVGVDGLAHVVAAIAQLREFVAGNVFDGRVVSGAVVNADLCVVWKKEAAFDVVGVCVGAGAAGAP